ncbi:hypothetical protein [Desulfocicer vacuolatum]|uniref:hypothetical protein n=1 Tax=Desulfocicer vacuolatum TaxID=2298 RepID=UPI001BB09B26|nr:hypothetical protein [Desulfocicer vacuolatum]
MKSESYIFGKKNIIEKRIKENGFTITERWKVRLTFGDIFRLYHGWIPRITTLMRLPPLFKLDMYLLEGHDAVNRMYRLKHRIRHEIWGRDFKKGGFLHTPDCMEEARIHKAIISKRKIKTLQ